MDDALVMQSLRTQRDLPNDVYDMCNVGGSFSDLSRRNFPKINLFEML
jgi:hypothetical protein